MYRLRKICAHADGLIVAYSQAFAYPLARFAFFVVFFWFGILKLFGSSPANELVRTLLSHTLPKIPFADFFVFLGTYEILIGLLFVLPGLERVGIALLIPHMFTTFLPLILLPDITWAGFMTPTLEGQYIIKNLALVALAAFLGANAYTNNAKRQRARR